jgi:hypothetical protein
MEVDFDCPSPRFSLTSPESISEFRAHLDAYGYAVVASAADSNQVATLKSLQWDLLEGPTKCLDRNDHQTWEHPAWYPNPSNGIVPGAGHSEFMWQLRQLPKVLQAFSVIWKTPPSSLITSFDVCNAFRPYVTRMCERSEREQRATQPKSSSVGNWGLRPELQQKSGCAWLLTGTPD